MRIRPSLLVRTLCLFSSLCVSATLGCTPKRSGQAGGEINSPEAGGSDALGFHPSPGITDEPAPSGDKDGEEKPKWDVANPPGPKKEIAIETDEGTWMSVDVSPDGKTIVFDLLGDLYTIPLGGGTATSLTSGLPWDMQPRYSPDGKWIAFTSDRNGGDNIWVIPAGGGEPKQITKETFRLVNSPTWSPDGQYIAVRKHFTAQRSLGSGEVWLYHIGGSKGLALTEKPNDQKDVGEPAFSPDGRYVYYSQDSTPGRVFEYNKNPHAGIYTIFRLDREEGHIDTVTGGIGGAVRPTPSPDGKSLAFVRRVGLDTALFVRDLESGAERGIDYKLDRDMQETWAIHGVYPTVAWTPDSQELVYWAGGKLHRTNAATTERKEVPFSVKDTRTIVEAVRSPIEVHPDTSHTKMLRWVSVAPDRKSVVFQALGHLYVRDLPSGKPRRLTKDDDVLEFYPSFSRDSKSIVFVAWSDKKLGSIRIVPRGGGKARTVTKAPGHYFDPALSPDGEHVVYRKGSGGWLTSPKWSGDTGLWVSKVDGSGARRLSRHGGSPQFGDDPSRVYFTARGSKDETPRELRSIELTGAKQRTLVRSAKATDFEVSPDGKWLAFVESFNAYITPFPRSPKPYVLGPKSESVPVAKVSADAGEYLHWAGDSRRLYWALGPELFARDLPEAFDFVDGAPEELPKPPTKGTDIGFDFDTDKPDTTFAIVGARLVTMKGAEVIEDGTIVVRGDEIVAIGPRSTVEVPAKAKSIDGKGMTVIPGLVDVHAHGSQGENGITPQQNWLHYATLAFGVTTVHDPSNDTAEIFAAAEMARAGLLVAPRIFSTGTILYGAKAPFTAKVESLEDARTHLRRMKAVGAFSVKSYNQPRRNQRQQIVAAARELDMMVVPEGGSTLQHNLNMIADGHTGIEHAIPIAKGYRDVVQLWSGTEVGYTPTIGVGYGGLWGENYWYAHTNVFDQPRLKAFVPPSAYEGRSRRRTLASRGDWNHIRVAQLCKKLVDAGVDVQLGAHGQREGLAAHWELWMFVQGGMTPHEALRSGTIHGARYIGLDGDIGSLEVGKLADLAIIEGNPLEDIRRTDQVRYTMVGGRLFDAKTMKEIGGKDRTPDPFFWQRSGGSTRPTTVQTHH